MIICPKCSNENRDNARFCRSCGNALGNELICPQCNFSNLPGSRFCSGCGTALVVQPPPTRLADGSLPINTLLKSRYVIVSKIAQGGMGTIYQVKDTRLADKICVAKEMLETFLDPTERTSAIESFRKEAEILSHLDHPNLPKVIDFFEDNGRQYLILEYIEGQSLEYMLRSRQSPFSESEVKEWARQLFDVLHYLHTRRPPVIFRDLKPANIMITNTNQVKLIDFGIARFFRSGQSKDTIALGTIGYAPKEQYGKGQTDARSDVYALGATLHHLLTNIDPQLQPFSFAPIRKINHTVSSAVESTIMKALEMEPENRFQSIKDMERAMFDKGVEEYTASSHIAAARQAEKRKNYKVAIEHYLQALKIGGENSGIHTALSWAYSDIYDYDTAIYHAQHAIRLESTDGDSYQALGYAYMKKYESDNFINYKYLKLCLDTYKKALEFENVNRSWLHAQISWCYNRKGDYQLAVEHAKKSLEYDQMYGFAYRQLGAALENQNKMDEAILNYRLGCRYDPTDYWAYLGLARCLNEKNNFKEAEKEAKKAISIAPEKTGGYKELGWCYEKQDRIKEALIQYKHAAEIDPGDEWLRKRIKHLESEEL